MALIGRVSRLFTADLHAVLDQLEEPDVLVKQAIREMDEEIVKQERRLKNLNQERAELAKRMAQVGDSLVELDGRLDLCFETGNEELARQVTRRKLEAQRIEQLLASRREGLDETVEELEACVAANRDRLEGMRQKAELLSDRVEADADIGRFLDNRDDCRGRIDDTEVELAFLREKQSRGAS